MIKPGFLKWNEIRSIAEDFRKKYVDPPSLVPVPIEEIIEFKLGLEIRPLNSLRSLKYKCFALSILYLVLKRIGTLTNQLIITFSSYF
jgi:hypothetical protein